MTQPLSFIIESLLFVAEEPLSVHQLKAILETDDADAIRSALQELADEYAGKVKVGKLDVDNNPQVAMRYAVRSIPTILLFKNGEVVDTVVGAVPKANLQKVIEKHLTPGN